MFGLELIVISKI